MILLSMKFTQNMKEIKNVLKDKELLQQIYGIESVPQKIELDINSKYLGIYDKQELIGFFQVSEITKITSKVHIALSSKYQKKGLALHLIDMARRYFKDNTEIKTVITTVPIESVHVLKLFEKTDFKVCGQIHNSVIYNNKIQDMILFELEV